MVDLRQARTLLALGVLLVAVAAEPGAASAQGTKSAATGRFLVNTLSGKCLDVTGAPGFANGAQIQIANCEYSGRTSNGAATDQRWEMLAGGFIRNTTSGKCIDVSGAPGFANGSKIQLWDCELSGRGRNGSLSDQRWEILASGFIRNLTSGKCIDVKGLGNKTHGADVQLWDCNLKAAATTDQRWQWAAEAPVPHASPARGAQFAPVFYRQNDQAAVYLQYAPALFCHVQNEDQMAAFGGFSRVKVVAKLQLAGKQTGACGWPNGFFRRSNQPAVYRLHGPGLAALNVGNSICHVVNEQQMAAYGGFGHVRVINPASDLGRGRGAVSPCPNP